MKLKTLLLSGIAAILAVGSASAQTSIYIAGAPAGRQYFSKAIFDALGGTAAHIGFAYSASSLVTVTSSTAFTYSNALTFFGGTVNGTPVTVYVTYPGSSASIQDIATPGGATAPFLSASESSTNTIYPDPTSASTPAGNIAQVIPTVAAADEFQNSTPWQGTNNLVGSSHPNPSVTYNTLDFDIAGIVPYRFVASPDAPSYLTNITPQQAQVLFTTGYIYASQLTGSSSDSTTAIYALGRDIGSGLRTVLLAETGIGGPTVNVKQFAPSTTLTNGTYVTTSQTPYPAETVNGVPLKAGDGGYPSFSKILPAISSRTETAGGTLVGSGTNYPAAGATKAFYITALDDGDAITVEANGAHELAYNGFYAAGTPGATLPTNGSGTPSIDNGQYTFWSYLQLQYLDSEKQNNTLNYQFEQELFSSLANSDSPVLLNSVNVSRQTDGGNITEGQQYQQ